MALKGSELKKKLPEAGKKNCKECGFPTCFAFAMKVVKGDAHIEKCPHVSPDVIAEVNEALTPPMVLVTIGRNGHSLEIGQEEVMYRHEKSFFRQTGVAVLVSDMETDEEIDRKLGLVKNSVFERAQVTIKPDLWAIRYDSGDRTRFEQVVTKIHEASPLSAVIISEDLDSLFLARDLYADRNPLIYPITEHNIDSAIPRIKERPTPVGVKAEGVEKLIPLTETLKRNGINQLVLDPSSRNLLDTIQDQTIIRRATLKKGFRPLGYPTIAFPGNWTNDAVTETLCAGAAVAKYASVIVTSHAEKDYLFPLLIQRMDIYSDPRKLRTVEPKVYEICNPDEESPVLVTTNFALTFFNVFSEAESSRVPVYLAILNTQGFGVQTAMGAGKFDSTIIADYLRKNGLDDKLKTKRLILPWIAGRVKHGLKDDLPDWEVYVGPRAINRLAPFLVESVGNWGLKSSD